MDTILKRFYKNAVRMRNCTCFKIKDGGVWLDLSWGDVLSKVKAVAGSLAALGVKRGDSVAIFSSTRYEWTVIDLAVLSIGAVTVPVYHTLNANEIHYILKHSCAKVGFVENAGLAETLDKIIADTDLEKIAVIDGDGASGGFCEFTRLATTYQMTDEDYKNLIESVNPDDAATCVYTSGTTGEQKGAVITHANIIGEVNGLEEVFDFKNNEIGFLFLPLAHVIARAMQFYQLSHGCITAYAESVDKIAENLKEVKPHFMAVVPRVIEKIYEKIMSKEASLSFPMRLIFKLGMRVGRRASMDIRMYKKLSPLRSAGYWLVRKVVFSGIRRRLGGRLKVIISGGAPLDKTVAEFFHAVGLLIIEGYGLTETMAAVSINRMDDFRFGTVGKPLAGTEIKLAEDGEVMVMGPQVFKGYREPVPPSDKGVFEAGWFKTGDIGEFSRDGFLRIVDRKKEIIVTSTGKNISPQKVENMVKTSPYIKEAVVFGNNRKFLVALVTLNLDLLQGIAEGDRYQLIKSEIEGKNRHLARHETIKKFVILDHNFSQESGELTPTQKLRRRKIYERYKDVIENMYK